MFTFFHTKHLIVTTIFIIFVLIYSFTSSALKREVVYRVYDVLNDDCLEDEITELKLGNKSKHLSKFKMQCEEQGKTHVNDQLKECVIPATTALVIKNEIAIINLRLHHLDQSNLYHLFAMESAWWCLYMTIKTLKPNYKKIIIEPIGVTNLTHSGAIGLLKAFSSSSSPAAPAAAGDIYEVYGPSVSVYHSRQIGFKLPWPLWSHTHFQKHLKPHPLTMEMAKYIVDSCPVVTRTKEIDILLIQRSKSRRLVDSQTGESDTVFHILSQLTPNLKVVEFSNTDNFCDIVSLIQSAKIIIGVHGAGLTNLAWANPNTTTVIEILMRPGFQDLYIKSEYTNMARFFGIKYKYFDSIKVYPHLCGVYCEKVFINTKELKESILLKR